MQSLMDAAYADGRALTDDEITGILLTVLFAGQHTSAVLATWTGLELMRAPEYVDRVRDETQAVYADTGTMSLEGLKQQVTMEHAVRECERLHPPLIILIRKVLQPMRYGDYVVPEGALAMVSPAVSHRLPHLFADPDRFDPDRFAPPAREDKQHHYALIGFGGGKHRCMGKHFAETQIQAIWTVLLDSLRFQSGDRLPGPQLRQLGHGSRDALSAPLPASLGRKRLQVTGTGGNRYDVAIVGAGPVGQRVRDRPCAKGLSGSPCSRRIPRPPIDWPESGCTLQPRES